MTAAHSDTQGVSHRAQPGRLPPPGRLHVSREGRGGATASAAITYARAGGALVAARECAQAAGLQQGRPRRHAAVQLVADARGAFRRSRPRAGSWSRSTTGSAAPRSATSSSTAAPATCCRRRARAARRPAGRSPTSRVIRCDHGGGAGDQYEQLLAARVARDACPRAGSRTRRRRSRSTTPRARPGAKGVQYTYRGAYLNALSEVIVAGMSTESVYLWTLPMFHCNGWCFPWAVTAVAARHVALRARRPRTRSGELIDERGRDPLQRRARPSS